MASSSEAIDLEISGGSVFSTITGKFEEKTILVTGGKISSITPPSQHLNDSDVKKRLHVKGCLVTPGFVDCAVRMRDPGFEYRDSMEIELKAAAAGGLTRIVCPPDTEPVLDQPGLVKMLIKQSSVIGATEVLPLGALTKNLNGQQIAEMRELSDAGCIGFSQANFPVKNTLVLFKAFQYASNFNFPIWMSAIDPWIGNDGDMNSSLTCARLGLKGIPDYAEALSLEALINLATQTGVRLHVCRISSRKGVEIIRRAKLDGINVTADVGVHHLHLTDVDVGPFNTNCKVFPPFRSQRDVDGLTEGLLDGTIDCICSDHSPVDIEKKNLPFPEAKAGVIGTELLLPLTLSWANKNSIDLKIAMDLISSKPTDLIGVKGDYLLEGARANLTIFNPQQRWVVKEQTLKSQGKNTPFLDYEMFGRIKATIISGTCVYIDEENH